MNNDRIEKMRAKGLDVSWYDKSPRKPREPEFSKKEACGRFTLYYLEGDHAWTVNHDGTKYMKFKEAKKTITDPAWYCSACNQRFKTWDEAKEHHEVDRPSQEEGRASVPPQQPEGGAAPTVTPYD